MSVKLNRYVFMLVESERQYDRATLADVLDILLDSGI
jgi:hypothetical protein